MLGLPRLAWGAVAALALAAAAVSPPAASITPSTPDGSPDASAPLQRCIVRLAPADPDHVALAAAVRRSGGRVVSVQDALGLVVVDLPGGAAGPAASAVRSVPGVRDLSPDRSLTPTSLGFDPATQPGAMTNVTRITGAQAMWRAGFTGGGVDVALLDSGVAPVPSLSNAAKVVVGPDLSFESQNPDLRYLDTFGHGTHMASIIAGRETGVLPGPRYAADGSDYLGMAPDARLVSVKLADHDGAVDVSQVIAGIDWVVQNRTTSGLNIRVLNLSYGTQSPQDWQSDPLSWAAEVAWHRGIVVVASAGNDGSHGLSNPAYNPWVLAVGAADAAGTDDRGDDVVASYSARQGGTWPDRGPDVVAPGDRIVAAGVPGSALYTAYPAAHVGNGFLRGSGTSQAAAVVSGAVALLLDQRPALTPDQVKDLLERTATPLAGETPASEGAGEIDLARARTTAASWFALQLWPRGDGSGSLESARNGFHVTMDGVDLTGEQDIMSQAWNSTLLGRLALALAAWGSDGSFNGALWTGTGFATDTTSWAGKTWSGKTWSGKTWSGTTWSGSVWNGKTWSGAVWNGTTWTSATWPSMTTDTDLSAKIWSSVSWL
jgi:serine protease AprX